MTIIRSVAALLLAGAVATQTMADDSTACLQCHPTRAKPTALLGTPILAGQHPQYLLKQLEAFASGNDEGGGRRKHITMSDEAALLPREKWPDVVETLSKGICVNLGGSEISTIASNPCAKCHGDRGLSGNPEIPNLAGQDPRYMFRQYNRFREQFATNHPRPRADGLTARLHPVMSPLSAEISHDVITFIQYYSRLPCR